MQDEAQRLIEEYRRGRVEALETLVQRYRRPLFGFLLSMGISVAEAEDAFQDTWLRVMNRLDQYRTGNFPGWLMRIARNLVIDRYRTTRRTEPLLDPGEEGGRPEPADHRIRAPATQLADRELGRRINAAVAMLPDEQQEVFLLRTQGDVPFRAIARLQGCSVNTALARMHYAVGKLRVLLADERENVKR